MVSMRSDAFWARMVDLGLEDCIGACKTKGLDTMAKFAFRCEFNPQNPDSSKLTEDLLKP